MPLLIDDSIEGIGALPVFTTHGSVVVHPGKPMSW
jgi:hypothetical protein